MSQFNDIKGRPNLTHRVDVLHTSRSKSFLGLLKEKYAYIICFVDKTQDKLLFFALYCQTSNSTICRDWNLLSISVYHLKPAKISCDSWPTDSLVCKLQFMLLPIFRCSASPYVVRSHQKRIVECKIQKNWCTVTVAPTIEYHGGHSRTPANLKIQF